MPLNSQSLTTWVQTFYTSDVASSYKSKIDAITSIGANPAGSLYVYPNSPAGMSVLVDPAFNLPQLGLTSPFLLNTAASPATVSLTAPGANSYYATIYWDTTTNTAGVVYGATGVSPTPILPDQVWRIPLAVVLLTTGQVTVAATNIFDVRTWFSFRGPLNAAPTLPATVNCQGATSVTVRSTQSVNSTLTLTNLMVGVPVFVYAANTAGGGVTFTVSASTPSGAAYTLAIKQNGVAAVVTITIATSNNAFLAGTTFAGPNIYMLVNN